MGTSFHLAAEDDNVWDDPIAWQQIYAPQKEKRRCGMKSSSHFTVFEYGHLVSEEGDARINNAVVLPADLFKWLELRCLKDDADNTHRLLTLSSRNGVKTLQVKNYAGVISLPGGRFLEILPKTGQDNEDTVRQQLLMMLRTLQKIISSYCLL